MQNVKTKILLVLLATTVQLATAQSEMGSWNILSVKTSVSDRWGLFAEGQVRSLGFYTNYHYHELKGGASYALDKNFSFAMAAGKYDTYHPGGDFVTPKASDEVRLFEQMTMSQYLHRIKFEHRYRAEQRFTKNGYRNRFRYRLQALIPLNGHKVAPKVWYVSGNGEIFFTDTPAYFERIRTYVGVGHQLSASWAVQIGYLHQFDYRLVDETGKDFLQVSLLWDIRLHKKEQEKIPAHVD